MTIRIEGNSAELLRDAQGLAEKFRTSGEEAEVSGPIRKSASAEQVAIEVLKLYFAYEVGKRVFERVDLMLAEWFTEQPPRKRPPLRVELYDHEQDLVATRSFGGAAS